MELATNLPESRLQAIERGAQEQHTLGSRVTCELVDEIRRLRSALRDVDQPEP